MGMLLDGTRWVKREPLPTLSVSCGVEFSGYTSVFAPLGGDRPIVADRSAGQWAAVRDTKTRTDGAVRDIPLAIGWCLVGVSNRVEAETMLAAFHFSGFFPPS